MKITYDGKEYEFRGQYKEPSNGENFLSGMHDGSVIHQSGQWDGQGVRAIVHPVPVIHEFGGVTFVETGEVRPANDGEWFLDGGCKVPIACKYTVGSKHIILKPIHLVTSDINLEV